MYKSGLVFIFALTGLLACKKKAVPVDTKEDTSKGTYFSIMQFTQDQYNTFHGQPFTLARIVSENGKTDTAYVSSDTLSWADVFKVFFESDIGDKKYLGKYNFSMFDEDKTITRNYYYEAKEDNLFTRKMQIATDPNNNKIRAIYIETEKYDGHATVSRKLYYAPIRMIQIHQLEKTKSGKVTEKEVVYRFL